MGEYANLNGKQIKIGTCEDMYYLRADQAHLVRPERGSVNPLRDADSIRFRFPFPDEDSVAPGAFDDFDRAVYLWGVRAPAGVEHYAVQFSAPAGYLLSVPCPESGNLTLGFHRNGFRGYVGVQQQRVCNGRLVLIACCGGCGAKWRYETIEEAAPVIAELRATAARREDAAAKWWNEIADRIEAGYRDPLPWSHEAQL